MTLQHTATHRNTPQHTATHCNILQHPTTPYNTLQRCWRRLHTNFSRTESRAGIHIEWCCNTLQHIATHTATHCNALQRTTTLYNTLQHAATRCNTLQRYGRGPHTNLPRKESRVVYICRMTLQHSATRCHTPQHTATHCNTLQHTATHCNTLQHAVYICQMQTYLRVHVYTYSYTWQVQKKKNAVCMVYTCNIHIWCAICIVYTCKINMVKKHTQICAHK